MLCQTSAGDLLADDDDLDNVEPPQRAKRSPRFDERDENSQPTAEHEKKAEQTQQKGPSDIYKTSTDSDGKERSDDYIVDFTDPEATTGDNRTRTENPTASLVQSLDYFGHCP